MWIICPIAKPFCQTCQVFNCGLCSSDFKTNCSGKSWYVRLQANCPFTPTCWFALKNAKRGVSAFSPHSTIWCALVDGLKTIHCSFGKWIERWMTLGCWSVSGCNVSDWRWWKKSWMIAYHAIWTAKSTTQLRKALKSMVFAMGWKGEVWADLEQAQTHKHQHQIQHQSKTQITHSNCVRGRFWGMHRIDFVLASFLTIR